MGEVQGQLVSMRALVGRLPAGHRTTLAFLLAHLARVAGHAGATKMTAANLALVFAPGVLRSKEGSVGGLSDFQGQCDVMAALMRHHERLFADAD
jgi:hypothetical protein